MLLYFNVVRMFMPAGWQAPATRGEAEGFTARAYCRLHRQGLDIYLQPSGTHTAGPLGAPLTAAEYATNVLWLPGEAPHTAAHIVAAPSPPPRPPSTRQPPSQPPHPTDSPPPRVITLFGTQRALWGGRLTVVPTAAVVSPWPGRCSSALPQLQVFLYDQRAWRQVALTEAADTGLGARGAARGVEAASGPGYDDALPLRLALRPHGNPWLRGPGCGPLQDAAATAAIAAALPSATPAATASAAAAAAGSGLGPTGSLAQSGGGASLPAAPASPSSQVHVCRALQRAAGCAVRRSATARHIQHMAACVRALYDLYGMRCPQGDSTAAAAAGGGSAAWVGLARDAADRTERLTGLRWRRRRDPTPGRRSAASSPGSQRTEATETAVVGSGAVTGSLQLPQQRNRAAPPTSNLKGGQQGLGVEGQAAVGAGGMACGWEAKAAVAAAAAVAPPPRLRGRAAVAAACLVPSLLLQLLAGPTLAAAVWRRRAALMGAAEGAAAAAERLLRQQYNWLMTATPAGVKLHAELCALLGMAAHGVLTVAAAAARWSWPACGPAAVGLLAAGCALAGLGGGLAVLHDLLAAASLPLGLQAGLSSQLLRRHLAWLRAAWQLMKGRQQKRKQQQRPHGRPPPSSSGVRPVPAGEEVAAAVGATQQAAACRWPWLLRQGARAERRGQGAGAGAGEAAGPLLPISRLESLLGLAPDPGSDNEVVVEQLIVGVLLGVPLLALLPTAAAWRLLALAAWGVPAVARAALAMAAGVLRINAALALAWRVLRPLDFAGPDVLVHCLGTDFAQGEALSAGRGCGRKGGSAAARGNAARLHDLPVAAAAAAAAASSGGGGGGGGGVVILVVEPLPLPWRRVAWTWLARGLRGGWGPPAAAPAASGGEGKEGHCKGMAACGEMVARLRWLWGA